MNIYNCTYKKYTISLQQIQTEQKGMVTKLETITILETSIGKTFS